MGGGSKELGRTCSLPIPANRRDVPSAPTARSLAWLSFAALVLLQVSGRHDLFSIIAISGIVMSFGRLPVRRPSAVVELGARLSFALFITHALTGLIWFGGLNALQRVLPLTPGLHWLLWAGSMPLALAVAALFHQRVDAPLQAWLARRQGAGSGPVDAPSVA